MIRKTLEKGVLQDTVQLDTRGSNSCFILLLLFGLQVLMKDIVTPVPPEEVKGVIRKCLEQAAQLNYERIKEYAKIEGKRAHSALSRDTLWQC